MTLPSLPALSVSVAFNPTNVYSTTQTWTDITQYVEEFSVRMGRQHQLDRVEASTLQMTVNNRTGFFHGNSGLILRGRLPIKITATWSSTAYAVFYGLTDNIQSHDLDALDAEVSLQASDQLKLLSLQYLYNASLYGTYVPQATLSSGAPTNTGAYNWYRCGQTSTGNSVVDKFGGSPLRVLGNVAVNSAGALVYDVDTAIDLTNGTNAPTGALSFATTDSTAASYGCGIDFWILSNQMQNATIFSSFLVGGFTASLSVNAVGQLVYTDTLTTVTHPTVIADGYWHHIGIATAAPGGTATNSYALYVDGVPVVIGTTSTGGVYVSNYVLGQTSVFSLPAIVDEIVVTISNVSTAYADTCSQIVNRYEAGSLISDSEATGGNIADVLIVAGYGSIVAGVPTVPNFYIDGVAFVDGATGNGVVQVQADGSAVTNSTALDLILKAAETEGGSFFQSNDGSFHFHTRAYPYSATNNATPTGSRVWTDDTTSTYHYVAPSLQVMRDDLDTWTSVNVNLENGTPQTYQNAAAQLLYGPGTLTRSSSASSTEAALQTANYLGYLYNGPLPRVGNVELRSETSNGANLPAMLGTGLDQVVTFKRSSVGAADGGVISSNFLVEAVTHEFVANPGYWHTSFVLDPYPLRASTQNSQYYLIADNATYGKSDTMIAL